jgi:hypothetical protein
MTKRTVSEQAVGLTTNFYYLQGVLRARKQYCFLSLTLVDDEGERLFVSEMLLKEGKSLCLEVT